MGIFYFFRRNRIKLKKNHVLFYKYRVQFYICFDIFISDQADKSALFLTGSALVDHALSPRRHWVKSCSSALLPYSSGALLSHWRFLSCYFKLSFRATNPSPYYVTPIPCPTTTFSSFSLNKKKKYPNPKFSLIIFRKEI